VTGAPVTLYHQSEGTGEPLLLLNGIAMSAVSWDVVARPLAKSYRVIRCDFRGQLMTLVSPPGDLAEHADDVAALLDHLGIERIHVIGTSFGGVVGTLVAARYPDRVRSLTTIASASGFDEGMADEVARWKAACVASLEGPDRGHLSDILESVVYSPAWVSAHAAERAQRREQISALPDQWFEGLIGLLDSAHSLRLGDELERVRCPTLVIAAAFDGFVPLERARGLAESIGGASFRVIEGAGHAVVVERPDLRSLER
jgi:pimeloyl-ACP methyl ester carboxylesterase